MGKSKKLTLSKETLRSLDDQDLADVASGGSRYYCGNSNNCQSQNGCNVSKGCGTGIGNC